MPVSIGDARFLKGYRIEGVPSDGAVPIFDAERRVFEWRDFYEVTEKVVYVYIQASAVLSTDPRPDNPINGSMIYEIDTQRAFVFISPEWRAIGSGQSVGSTSETDRRNIQLLFLQQAKLLDLSAGNAVDGFFDAFEDTSGVDGTLTRGYYSETGAFYTGVTGSSSQVATVHVESAGQFIRADDRGQIDRWYQDGGYRGHFEGPEKSINAGVAIDRGSGKTGFTATAHGMSAGQVVRFYGFSNDAYNGIFTLDSLTSYDEMVIPVIYTPEVIPAESRRYRSALSLGTGGQCENVGVGCNVRIGDIEYCIDWIDETTKGAGISKVQLSQIVSGGTVMYVTGPTVLDGSLTLKTAFNPEGSDNSSVVDAVPGQTDGQRVTASSETGTYYGWKVFDNEHGQAHRWLTLAGQTTGWITYDFGADNKTVINKYRWLTMESDSDAVPGAWQLEASDDNANWTVLHSGTNSVSAANTWIGYFTFRNDTAYRYYRFNVTANLGHTTYLVLDELEFIAAPEPNVPEGHHPVILADQYVLDCEAWDVLSGISVTDSNPGASAVNYAWTFDGGVTWKVYVDLVWRDIARNSNGVWEYRNDADTWSIASANTVFGALRQASNVGANVMDGNAVGAMDQAAWSGGGGWSSDVNAINAAMILKGSGQDAPGFSGLGADYEITDVDIDVVSKTYVADDTREYDRLVASILIKNKTESTKVYASSGSDIDWLELSPLVKMASLSNGVEFYSVTIDDYESDGFDMRLRVMSDVGHDTELHGYALSWG